jgi:hypothetical protein
MLPFQAYRYRSTITFCVSDTQETPLNALQVLDRIIRFGYKAPEVTRRVQHANLVSER